MGDVRNLPKGIQHERIAGTVLSGLAILYAITILLSHSAAYFAVAGLALFAIIIWRRTGGVAATFSRLRVPLLSLAAFVVWEILSRVLNGKQPTFAPFDDAPVLFSSLLLFGLTFDPGKKKEAAVKAVLVVSAASSLVVLLGILQHVTGLTYPLPKQPLRDGKLYGFFRYYIQAGCTFSTLAVFFSFLALYWRTSRTRRIMLGISAAFMFAGTVMTFARTYFLSLLGSLVLVFTRKSLRTAVLGATAMAAVIAIVFALFPPVRSRAASIFDVHKNPSNVERLYLMRIAADIITDHPVIGVGQREWEHTAGAYSTPYRKDWNFSEALYAHAHNVYLTVASETGLVGLALFLTFWLSVAVLLLRKTPGGQGTTSWALNQGTGYALINLFMGGVFDESLRRPLSFLCIAFLIAVALLARDAPDEKV
ncbi:MAG: O-antigen ligase family protein [Nitrospiraceae bacterium]|nr:O-antigen ligase family protein [Nitrospiraceae bacterium]